MKTPDQVDAVAKFPRRPGRIHIEVSLKVYDAARAKPDKFRLVAEDANGVTLIEYLHFKGPDDTYTLVKGDK